MFLRKRNLILLSILASVTLTSCTPHELHKVGDLESKAEVNSSHQAKIEDKEEQSLNTYISKISSSEKHQIKKIQQKDFDITYKQEVIHKDTDIQTIIKRLGYGEGYEDNNKGFINSKGDYRRWNLSYPDYHQPQIRFIIQTNMNTEKESLAAVSIESPDIQTKRGLKVGDSIDRLYELYGQPTSYDNTNQIYSWGQLYMSVSLDEQRKKVNNIFVDYAGDPLVDPEEQDIRLQGEPWSEKAEYTLIANQSFDLPMSGWQNSRFVSAHYTIEGKKQAAFFITDRQEKRMKYRLADFYGNYLGQLDRIRAVDFRDMNGDGRKDIIILASYKKDNASKVTLSIASIYFQKQDKMFTFVPWLDQELNSRGYNHSLNEIIQYASEQHIEVN